MSSSNTGKRGYSSRIDDPAMARYVKNANSWSAIFASILAVAVISGFYIYGETSSEMDNPEAVIIGCIVGGIFILIALSQITGRNKSKTWDGVVIDKKTRLIRRKRSARKFTDQEEYTEYIVSIQDLDGKIHEISAEDDDTLYNYYKLADKVRHHGGLNSFEKYDKSGDSIIFCNACASLNDISDETCFRCKCPLLK